MNWEERKKVIQRRTYEKHTEWLKQEAFELGEVLGAARLAGEMLLPCDVRVEKFTSDFRNYLERKAKWIVEEKSKGKNMASQEREFEFLSVIPELIADVQWERDGLAVKITSEYEKQLNYREQQTKIALAKARQFENSYHDARAISELIEDIREKELQRKA